MAFFVRRISIPPSFLKADLKTALRYLKNTFRKTERLCSKKVIDNLFDRKNSTNESLFTYPVKVVFTPILDSTKSSQVLFSVSKRQFKRAVDRNLIKRRMKEAYRLHKSLFQNNFYIAFMFVGKEIEKYEVIEKGMKSALKKISTVK